MRPYSIYKVTVPDGRCYVGCTLTPIDVRWASHQVGGHNGWPAPRGSLAEALAMHGKDACTVEHIASALDPESAAATEEHLIAQHGTMTPAGYNLRARSAVKGKGRRVEPRKPQRDWLRVNPARKVAWPPHAVAP